MSTYTVTYKVRYSPWGKTFENTTTCDAPSPRQAKKLVRNRVYRSIQHSIMNIESARIWDIQAKKGA